MDDSIGFFGGMTHGRVTIGNNESTTSAIDQDFGFDRDIDGHWLVWASHGDAATIPGDHDNTGAIVVRDPGTIAFIELLGELFANPARFHDEPTFVLPPVDVPS